MGVLWTIYILFLACCFGLGFGSPNRCDEVRKVFQLRQIGPSQLLTPSPRPGMSSSRLVCITVWFIWVTVKFSCEPACHTSCHISSWLFVHFLRIAYIFITPKTSTCQPLIESNMPEKLFNTTLLSCIDHKLHRSFYPAIFRLLEALFIVKTHI